MQGVVTHAMSSTDSHVAARLDERALAATDLFFSAPAGAVHEVVRPADIGELAALLAAKSGERSLVVRGAGLSYTAGVVPSRPSAVIDMTGIDHIEIDAADLWVRVGAGCSWDRLARELAREGLRAPIAAPTSGLHSTVGGAVSQGLPGTMEAVIGLTVVLADGSRIVTGSGALAGRAPFNRHAGPDLTGLFIGDCGAFGVKAEVVLRLVRAPKTDFASFHFDDPLAMVATMVELQRELGLSSMGIDPVRTATALKAVSAAEAVQSVAGAAREAGSLRGAMRALVDMARTGADGERQAAGWSLHLTAEHPLEAGARALIEGARALVKDGSPIPPGIPRASRARPFSVRGALGPDAERWVPVHGVVPLSQAVPTMAALLDHAERQRARMEEAGVFMAWLTTSRHGAVLFEPMLFWPDALTPVHLRYMDEQLVATARGRSAPEATRAFVADLRRGLCEVLDRHGATHLQLGRYYEYAEILDPGTLRVVESLKSALDPERRLNPGQLGLGKDGAP